MSLVGRTRTRREMTTLAWLRRRIQQLTPYPSLLLLIAPLAIVEPAKLVALLIAGKGHWLSGTAMIVLAYAASLFIIERLFRVVKPKLLMLNWFATIWALLVKARSVIASWLGIQYERKSAPIAVPAASTPTEIPRAKP